MQNEAATLSTARAGEPLRQLGAETVSPAGLPNSVWFDLFLSLFIGFLFALYLLGPRVLDPTNLTWLHGDPTGHYIGWALYRQDQHWHWPVTYTDRIGYPLGTSVSLIDINPLLAVLFKSISFLLPASFQYFGLEALLLCTLQVFFSLRLFRLVLGANSPAIILPSLFFLIAPILTFRLAGHFSLSNQWLFGAALFIFVAANRHAPLRNRKFAAMVLGLAAIAMAINPYLAFQTVLMLAAAVIALVWCRRLTLRQGAGLAAAMALVCLASAYLFGFIIPGGQGYGAGGFREYCMNLLAPFNQEGFGSLFLKPLPELSAAQAEGYNYLGAGVIFLSIALLAIIVPRRTALKGIRRQAVVPLFVCCSLLTLLALSTRITFGSKVLVDLDPHQSLTPYIAALRCTGRLFWMPYYAFLFVLFALLYRLLSRRWANLLVFTALILQIADVTPLERWIHLSVNEQFQSPLTSPVWSGLGATYKHLVVLPAWQCDPGASPGSRNGAFVLGMLAVSQKMTVDSYFSGRYSAASQNLFCNAWITDLTRQPLASDSINIVTQPLAERITAARVGNCYAQNHFILCAAIGNPPLGPPYDESRDRLWIDRRFQILLDRLPTQAEEKKWKSKLSAGGESYGDFVVELLNSSEFQNKTLPRFWEFCGTHAECPSFSDLVTSNSSLPHVSGVNRQSGGPVAHDRNRAIATFLYFTILQRDPDPGGLAAATQFLAHAPLRDLVVSFLNSPEYASRDELHFP